MIINNMSSTNDNVTSSNSSSSSSTSSARLLGRVKWFNSKAGYGFISVTDGERAGTDIFVHHSAINVENQQYRYLVQGEYVEFSVLETPNSTHDCQASLVCGIKSGKLMCETRREFKIARSTYKSQSSQPSSHQTFSKPEQKDTTELPVQQRRDRYRKPSASRSSSSLSERPSTSSEENKNWTLSSNGRHTQNDNKPRPRVGRPRKTS